MVTCDELVIGDFVSARRVARELAVIVLSQLPKEKDKLEALELEAIASKAVSILSDYAKENLAEVDGLINKTNEELLDIEISHPTNVRSIAKILPVSLTTAQVREQLNTLKRSLNMVAEALDIPALSMQSHPTNLDFICQHCQQTNTYVFPSLDKSEVKKFFCRLINTYLEHKDSIVKFIRQAKAKWDVDRMVSIDRNILRLACTEAFYMEDIPVSVAINEAVELCHRFADEKAAKFINGILADLSEEAEHFRKHGAFQEKAATEER